MSIGPSSVHLPLPAAAPTGYLEQAGTQEGVGRCPQEPECQWTPEKPSLPAQGLGPECLAGRQYWLPHRGRRKRWRHCRHSCGQRPQQLSLRLHLAPPRLPVEARGSLTAEAALWSRAGRQAALVVSREHCREEAGSQGLGRPSFLQCPDVPSSPHLDLLDQFFRPQQLPFQLCNLLLHG